MNPWHYLLNNAALLLFACVVCVRREDELHAKVLKVSTLYLLLVLEIVLVLGVYAKRLDVGAVTLVCLPFLALALVIGFRRREHLLPLPALRGTFSFIETPLVRLLGIAVLIVYAFKLAAAFLLVPYGYDAASYHLPNLVDYIQAGRLCLAEKQVYSNCYPRSIEMLSLWQLVHLRNGLTLNLVQFFLTLLGGTAVYGLLKQERIKREFAFLGALLYLSTPLVLAQLNSGYIDTALASIFFVSLYFLNHYLKTGKREYLLYCGILFGLLLGAKYSAIAYWGIFLAAFAAVLWYRRERIGRALGAWFLVALLSLAVGGVWYGMNYILFNNPLHPFQVQFLGRTVFPGMSADSAIMNSNEPYLLHRLPGAGKVIVSWIGLGDESTQSFSLRSALFHSFAVTRYDHRVGGFGFQWPLVLLPAFALFLFRGVKKRSFTASEVLLFSVVILSFLATPANWWGRYVCFILLTGIYAIARREHSAALPFLGVLVLLGCLQGSLLDVRALTVTARRLQHIDNASLRSLDLQLYDDEYRQLISRVNGETPQKVIILPPFKRFEYLYHFAGDRTQNTVRLLPFDRRSGESVGIAGYADFKNLLDSEPYDFLFVPKAHQSRMRKYLKNHKYFTAEAEVSDGILYHKETELLQR